MISIPFIHSSAFKQHRVVTSKDELVSFVLDSLKSGDEQWSYNKPYLARNGLHIYSMSPFPCAQVFFNGQELTLSFWQMFRLWFAMRKWFSRDNNGKRSEFEERLAFTALSAVKSSQWMPKSAKQSGNSSSNANRAETNM